MSDTTHLKLPLIAAAQSQKHVTQNEAVRDLDLLVMVSVLELFRVSPPAASQNGDRYIIGENAIDAWEGHDFELAAWIDGAWAFFQPNRGWRVYNLDDDRLYALDINFSWEPIVGIPDSGAEIQNAALFGLGTTADAANPFSARINKALWTALYVGDGGDGDLFYTMNKEATAGDVGFLLQTNFVSKVLLGLFGSDNLRIAVSPDGSAFNDAIEIDEATGIVDLPSNPKFSGFTDFDNYIATNSWTTIGINTTNYNDQSAFDAGSNRFTAPVAGLYNFGATCLYKVNSSTSARMQARLLKNGTDVIPGSFGGITGAHVSEVTAVWLNVSAVLAANDTVELQGNFTGSDGYFAAVHTRFWGFNVA